MGRSEVHSRSRSPRRRGTCRVVAHRFRVPTARSSLPTQQHVLHTTTPTVVASPLGLHLQLPP